MAGLISPQTCDLAVVGAGIVGTITAQLAADRHPDWAIVLADRGLPGRGATAYSLAVGIPYAANPAVGRLVAESAPISSRLAATMPGSFRTLSAVAIVNAVKEADWLHRFQSPSPYGGGGLQSPSPSGGGQGGGLRLADADDLVRLRRRWPGLVLSNTDAVLSGLTATRAAPMSVVDSLVLDLRHRGVRCWEGTEVVRVAGGADGVELITADGRELLAARVVVAVGPWIGTDPWQSYADHLGVRIKKVVAMHLDIRPETDDPVVFFMGDDAFLLPDHAGDRYLFSFASREWDVLPDRAQLRITPDDRTVALEILSRRLPGLERHWMGGRVFCDAYTPEHIPIAAGFDGDHRICITTGSSGSGFRLAPGMALAALDYVGAPDLQAAAGGGTG